MKSKHGGKREGAGRPSVGTTRRISLTLPDEIWEFIDKRKEKRGVSQSQTLRTMLEDYFYPENNDDESDQLEINDEMRISIERIKALDTIHDYENTPDSIVNELIISNALAQILEGYKEK
jgi:metal-responsive CopG/Arc/MetJ family transcriptional regulator